MKKLLLLLVWMVSGLMAVHAENYPYRSDYLWLTSRNTMLISA